MKLEELRNQMRSGTFGKGVLKTKEPEKPAAPERAFKPVDELLKLSPEEIAAALVDEIKKVKGTGRGDANVEIAFPVDGVVSKETLAASAALLGLDPGALKAESSELGDDEKDDMASEILGVKFKKEAPRKTVVGFDGCVKVGAATEERFAEYSEEWFAEYSENGRLIRRHKLACVDEKTDKLYIVDVFKIRPRGGYRVWAHWLLRENFNAAYAAEQEMIECHSRKSAIAAANEIVERKIKKGYVLVA